MKNINTLAVQDADEIPYIVHLVNKNVLRRGLYIFFKFTPADTSKRSTKIYIYIPSGVRSKYLIQPEDMISVKEYILRSKLST